jgi:hypothetical protein
MASKVATENEAIIAGILDIGGFTDSEHVIHEALVDLDRKVRLNRLRALIQEADDEFERGEYDVWTPDLMDQIWDEAMEMNRRGLPLDPDVCG